MEIIQVIEKTNFNDAFLTIGIILIFLGITMGLYYYDNNFSATVLSLIMIIIGIIAIIIVPKNTNTYYEITLNEDVSAIEFLNKYELVEKQGESYIVKERIE